MGDDASCVQSEFGDEAVGFGQGMGEQTTEGDSIYAYQSARSNHGVWEAVYHTGGLCPSMQCNTFRCTQKDSLFSQYSTWLTPGATAAQAG
jgi:hypothetical protein